MDYSGLLSYSFLLSKREKTSASLPSKQSRRLSLGCARRNVNKKHVNYISEKKPKAFSGSIKKKTWLPVLVKKLRCWWKFIKILRQILISMLFTSLRSEESEAICCSSNNILPSWKQCIMHAYQVLSQSIQLLMKSTTVQTLGELRMRDTANWWAGPFRGGLPLV